MSTDRKFEYLFKDNNKFYYQGIKEIAKFKTIHLQILTLYKKRLNVLRSISLKKAFFIFVNLHTINRDVFIYYDNIYQLVIFARLAVESDQISYDIVL